MPFTIIDGAGPIVTAKITGELSKADVAQIQNIARAAIQRCGKISALLFFDQFRGWKTEPGWGDLTFLNEHDKNIEKIAIVGETRWKDDISAFLAKGFRHAAVYFFLPSEPYKARQWLKASSKT
ncbi:MAG TPA: STAS/SEC14 domain-containing protein [Verrucomicrobiae bacterium]|jgi:SpoIIAA-like|nr:STAS/SEC14 domain-containing protein [Verrucomicrobiae bacterium]